MTIDPQRSRKMTLGIAIAILASVVFLGFLVASVIGGYAGNWGWTGYGESTIIKATQHIDETTVKEDRAEDVQRAKTLWDWLGLLLVPGALAVVGIGFNRASDRRAKRDRREEAQHANKIEDDRQRAATLQTYFDAIGELLLEKGLSNTKPGDKARTLARARTLAALDRLDDVRKGRVIAFLYESELITKRTQQVTQQDNRPFLSRLLFPQAATQQSPIKEPPIISLAGASLEDAYLRGLILTGIVLDGAFLTRADLTEAILSDASLIDTIMVEAELPRATLDNANLTKADLSGANLQDAQLHETTLNGALLLKSPRPNRKDTNLSGAVGLATERLGHAQGDSETVLPDEDFIRPTSPSWQ